MDMLSILLAVIGLAAGRFGGKTMTEKSVQGKKD